MLKVVFFLLNVALIVVVVAVVFVVVVIVSVVVVVVVAPVINIAIFRNCSLLQIRWIPQLFGLLKLTLSIFFDQIKKLCVCAPVFGF